MGGRAAWGLILAVALAVCVSSAAPGEEDPVVAGQVSRVQGSAVLRRLGRELPLAVDAEVRPRDHVETAPDARVEITFRDGTRLVLGPAAELVVDSFLYAGHDGRGGQARFRLKAGPLLLSAGEVAGQKDGVVAVRTPVLTVGIRGTEFWTGLVEGRQGVLLLSGKVSVENTAGSAELAQVGEGVLVPFPEPPPRSEELADDAADWSGPDVPPARGGVPSPPQAWDPERVGRALESVSFVAP